MPLIVSKPMTAPHNNEKQKCLKATPWAFKESYQIGNRRRLKDGPKKIKSGAAVHHQPLQSTPHLSPLPSKTQPVKSRGNIRKS